MEDRGLVYQADGRSTSLMDAIRTVFLRPVDGETKARAGLLCSPLLRGPADASALG